MNDPIIQKYINLFDDYLDGKLPLDEIKGIEKAILDNPNLKDALKKHVEARSILRLEGENEQREIFQQRLNQKKENEQVNHNKTNQKNPRVLMMVMRVACSLLILIGFGFLFFQNPQNTNDALKFEDPSISQFRLNENSNDDQIWKDFLFLFNDKKYKEVLNKYNNEDLSEATIKHFGQIHLIVGVSQWREKLYDKANLTLDKIDESNAYYDQALWYKILNSKEKGDKENYKAALLKVMQNAEHYQYQQAKNWFSEIE